MQKLLLFLLLATGTVLPSQAQALYQLPSPAAIDSLRKQLWQSPPGSSARLAVLLRLSEGLLKRHDLLEEAVDSTPSYNKQAQALSQRRHDGPATIRILQIAGRLLTAGQQLAAAQAPLRESIRLSQQQDYKRLEALGWEYLAATYVSTAATASTIKACHRRGIALYRQLGDKLQEARLVSGIADESIVQGDHQQALQELTQAAALYRAAHCQNLQYLYSSLLYVHQKLGHYKQALHYGFEAIENAKATHDTIFIGSTYLKIANVYGELKQPTETLAYYQMSFRSFQRNQQQFDALSAMGHIAGVLISQNKPQEALDGLLGAIKETKYRVTPGSNPQIMYYLARGYMAVGAYKPAEHYYLMMLGALAQASDAQKLYAYFSMGQFYLATKQYSKARLYFTKSLALASQVGAQTRIIEAHWNLFRIDSAQGHYTAAIAHFQRHKALSDSLFSTAKSKQIADLQIQYDTKKKEQNIALLTKQNQVQQAGLRQREWQRNATLGGAVLLTLLLGVSYNRARLKRRSTHLLEEKQREINQKNSALEQVLSEKDGLLSEKESLLVEKEGLIVEKEGLLVEKEWMLKEIHHRVKNNLQIVSELLDSQLDNLREPQMQAIIRESQNRVQAMALVHQKLYQSQNLARVDMQEYIRDIVEHLLTSFHCEGVQEQLDIAPVELDVALATPLGLIINEAVTNSLKYAFPGQCPGAIRISLTQLPSQRYQLTLADDGVGLPAGFTISASRSMGLTLITGLSEQIEADLTFPTGPGMCICLEFEGARKAAPAELSAV